MRNPRAGQAGRGGDGSSRPAAGMRRPPPGKAGQQADPGTSSPARVSVSVNDRLEGMGRGPVQMGRLSENPQLCGISDCLRRKRERVGGRGGGFGLCILDPKCIEKTANACICGSSLGAEGHRGAIALRSTLGAKSPSHVAHHDATPSRMSRTTWFGGSSPEGDLLANPGLKHQAPSTLSTKLPS